MRPAITHTSTGAPARISARVDEEGMRRGSNGGGEDKDAPIWVQ